MLSTQLIPDVTAFRRNWGWFLVWGIIMVILGITALSLTVLTTIATILVLGVFLFIAGLVIVFDTFKFWWGHWGGFLLHLLIGLLYITVGVILFRNPIVGSISLTFFIGFFYLLVGLFRLLYSVSLRGPRWHLAFLNAIISLILGILILYSWPSSGLWIIGLFIGIDLLFTGILYIMLSTSARSYA